MCHDPLEANPSLGAGSAGRRGHPGVYALQTSRPLSPREHLDWYAPGLREGDVLRKGSLVGYVGTTGNAPPDAPHLHFGILALTPARLWWQGVPVNPFRVWVVAE